MGMSFQSGPPPACLVACVAAGVVACVVAGVVDGVDVDGGVWVAPLFFDPQPAKPAITKSATITSSSNLVFNLILLLIYFLVGSQLPRGYGLFPACGLSCFSAMS